MDCVFHVHDDGEKIPVFGQELLPIFPSHIISDVPKPSFEPISPQVGDSEHGKVLNYYVIGETTTGSRKHLSDKLFQMERILTVYKHYKDIEDICSIVRLVFFSRIKNDSDELGELIQVNQIKYPCLHRLFQAGRLYLLMVPDLSPGTAGIEMSDHFSGFVRAEEFKQSKIDTQIKEAELEIKNMERKKDLLLLDLDRAERLKDQVLIEFIKDKLKRLIMAD